MQKLTDTRSLLIMQLELLLDAESLQFKEFPQILDKVSNPVLRKIIEKHAVQIEVQISKLEQVFTSLHVPIHRGSCIAMDALLDETLEVIDSSFTDEVADAGILTCLQKIALYQVAAYGAACNYAFTINDQKAANLLHENLEEERRFDNALSRLAEATINAKAVTPHNEISFM